ncbi:MAG: hypothetical protein ACXABI_14840 [Candidatus Hodarchaeales archaeon]|jgi:sulfur carrier protein ThiS
MKSVKLELVASVRNPFSGERTISIDFSGEKTVSDILLENGFHKDELEFLIPIVNGNRVLHDYKIQDQDHIWITLPIGGGS